MKADSYSLNANMMHIADHPADPWLETHLKSLGLIVYKYGDAPAPTPKSTRAPAVVIGTTDAPQKAGEQGIVSQKLLDYLATKVQE